MRHELTRRYRMSAMRWTPRRAPLWKALESAQASLAGEYVVAIDEMMSHPLSPSPSPFPFPCLFALCVFALCVSALL